VPAAVNISSSCAYAPVPQASAYTASKFAIRGYTDAVRVELAPFGVHAMLVAPGAAALGY
jgi:short-subunit dehydrogenase